jgi:hypothetical protein
LNFPVQTRDKRLVYGQKLITKVVVSADMGKIWKFPNLEACFTGLAWFWKIFGIKIIISFVRMY